ncbi:hypothetical protein [Sediminispirochaeta bajacaliforniensis]|uniref:hypothetical protein n=1 Tax=Sediminispirochaeta bajacaliforniensis TaxID=148 RepID=UPI0012B5F81D|nr:hypothetical protein [Sediminispirochaeta bajacaliforniensis]
MKKLLLTMSAVTGILLSAGCPLPTHRGDTSGDVTPQRYAITVNSTGEVNGEKVTASVSEATEGTIVTLSATLDSSTRKVSFSTSESGITPPYNFYYKLQNDVYHAGKISSNYGNLC